MPTPTPFLDLMAEWVPAQRWFASKGRAPALRQIGGWEMPSQGVRVRTHLLMDHSGALPTLYQVPVTERVVPLEGAEGALIGTLTDEQGDLRYLYDGPHDPAYARGLLRLIALGSHAIPEGANAFGVTFGDAGPVNVLSSKVLSGEQSNTSIIYELASDIGVKQVICKVFRALHHGNNPDVDLQSALAVAGCLNVPGSIGCVVGEWNDVGRADGRARGHAAFAQDFVAGAEDAWRYALRVAGAGEDFTSRARELGVVTAEVHSILAEVLPTREAEPADIDATLASWRRRLDLAVAEVPVVAEFGELIDRLYSSVGHLRWPRLQRIHGDFHLGQVLAAPDGRWMLLDFEGEPLRPMVERSQADFAVRDVAGMLRSFDYVAGSLGGGEQAEKWAGDSRRAFLDGYIERSGFDLRAQRSLLDAFEVDKAIYEAVYEARNRPDWLPIPTAALKRLADRARLALA
ncbi:MAG: putative maltokinase [Cryobacterium sp.]|jgi:maltokinase|nr:putative maltokinase [Cryobacterium sp.]